MENETLKKQKTGWYMLLLYVRFIPVCSCFHFKKWSSRSGRFKDGCLCFVGARCLDSFARFLVAGWGSSSTGVFGVALRVRYPRAGVLHAAQCKNHPLLHSFQAHVQTGGWWTSLQNLLLPRLMRSMLRSLATLLSSDGLCVNEA